MRTPDPARQWGWKTIFADLADQIDTGVLPPGARLPSRTILATLYGGVNPTTVARALGSLETTGRTRGRQGAHITVVGPATVLPPAAPPEELPEHGGAPTS
jgi:DNA-binding GntR family transcriptional regulator